ncbi:MAG: hypothetical protein JWN06_1336 [Propionibacteriaceae bacterium]|jgi:hypothetical protein|nr:hypothetical protein [Propionibacteriaceae bacterium]
MRKFVSEATPGLVGVLLAFLVLDGASVLWAGGQQLQPARELSRSGRVVTATESLVYLRVDRGLVLRQVRVRTDIRPELVYLTDVQDKTDLDDLDQPPPVGWQPATAVTGYEAPFEIRYLRDQDGTIVAMASDDITSQGSYEPIVEALAEISLGLIVAGIATLWLRRRSQSRRAASEPTA